MATGHKRKYGAIDGRVECEAAEILCSLSSITPDADRWRQNYAESYRSNTSPTMSGMKNDLRDRSRQAPKTFALPVPRALVTPPTTPENNSKASDGSPTPPPSTANGADSHSEFISRINLEQRNLLRDPRTKAQLQWFKNVQDSKPATYYSVLAPIGIHILEHGRAAQTHQSDRAQADFLIGDCEEFESWLQTGAGDKLYVLRDPKWLHTRPSLSSGAFFDGLEAKSVDKSLVLEVQELGKEFGPFVNAVEPMEIHKILERRAVKDQSIPPLNLLNLMCKDDGYQPWPLSKHCNLLNKAAAACASVTQSAIANVGKEATVNLTKLIDLESCMHFMIFGQAGAISTWHIDAIGPYTYITLEPNEEGESPEKVLKLWAYVRTDHLSEAERAEIRLQFQREHEAFKPKPELIRIIALVAGDTLIMPPGTIHAPITITDCLFRGGMVMQQSQMRRSMREWRFCSDNGRCTNEEQPRQARGMLDFFNREVHRNPAACGYEEEGGIAEFESDYRQLSGSTMTCNCKSGCSKKKCQCMGNSQRCGSQCHGGITKCENPFGCEVETKVVGKFGDREGTLRR